MFGLIDHSRIPRNHCCPEDVIIAFVDLIAGDREYFSEMTFNLVLGEGFLIQEPWYK